MILTNAPIGRLTGMAAIQNALDVSPYARLAAAMLWSAAIDARGCDELAHDARWWLTTHGPDWLGIILEDAEDPRVMLEEFLAGESWFER